MALAMAGACSAQLPDFYKAVNRVTWVIENLDKVRPAWEKLGLKDIRFYQNIELTGQYKGKPVAVNAWQVTGQIGNLTVDMIQPGEGNPCAYTNYLGKHGDGILSIVYEAPSGEALDKEIARMKGLGVDVLQQVTFQPKGETPIIYTYFDTEPQGKFALGLVYRSGGMKNPTGPATVTHLAPVVWDGTAVSAYWAKLGFPAFPMAHATPRDDSRYKGQPLSLYFDVGFQRHAQFRIEWIAPPATPANIYADFLNRRKREGIQHIGIVVPDLPKAIADYEKLGYHVHQSGAWGDIGKTNSGQYAYMDTDTSGGVSVELVRQY